MLRVNIKYQCYREAGVEHDYWARLHLHVPHVSHVSHVLHVINVLHVSHVFMSFSFLLSLMYPMLQLY